MQDELIGVSLGQYQIVDSLGKGGMASVYKAYQPALERYVAVKVLPPYFAHDAVFSERFRREARAIAQLEHPHILPVYDFGEDRGLAYIVMSLVPGGTLKERMGQPLSLDFTIRACTQIAAALDHANSRGVVHRDVKPSNILLGQQDWLFLADFGIAKLADANHALTKTGMGVGTPEYLSPEQGRGLPLDGRADQYALAMTVFELLAGTVPYQGDTPIGVVLKQINDPVPSLRKYDPHVSPDVDAVLQRALSKDRDARFPTATDFADALGHAAQGGPIAERPTVLAAPTPPPIMPALARPSAAGARTPTRGTLLMGAGIMLVVLFGLVLAMRSLGLSSAASGPYEADRLAALAVAGTSTAESQSSLLAATATQEAGLVLQATATAEIAATLDAIATAQAELAAAIAEATAQAEEGAATATAQAEFASARATASAVATPTTRPTAMAAPTRAPAPVTPTAAPTRALVAQPPAQQSKLMVQIESADCRSVRGVVVGGGQPAREYQLKGFVTGQAGFQRQLFEEQRINPARFEVEYSVRLLPGTYEIAVGALKPGFIASDPTKRAVTCPDRGA